MDIHDAATLTETSLREQLTTTEAPTGEDHFALTLKRVEVEDASTLRVVFGVGMVFRTSLVWAMMSRVETEPLLPTDRNTVFCPASRTGWVCGW